MKRNIFLTVLMAVVFFIGMVRPSQTQETKLKFAITAAVGSDPSFTNYKELTDYIAGKLGKKSLLISGLTYNQVDMLLSQGQVEVGFLCNTHYARRKKEVGFEPLAAPIVTGYDKPKFQVYTIVHKASDIASLNDLKDKTVDLSDPLSTTTIYAAYMLLKKDEDIKSYFGKAIFSGSHDMTVKLVANRLVDGGFIDGHIWDYHDKVRPLHSAKTKVIHKSPYFTIPPVVVPATMDAAMKKEIKHILLKLHLDTKGKEILKKLRIERFVDIKDEDYYDVLQMYNNVKDRI